MYSRKWYRDRDTIQDALQDRHDHLRQNPFYSPWLTAPEIARLLGWSEQKIRRLLERMVDERWLIWRWHPKRYGWYATKQYSLAWLGNFKPK